jgi:hypothetical protein
MAKDEKIFKNLHHSAVEYINLVIKNMRYRKIARDEVREELVDHFEVYLKDCATNEEKEQKAQQLISEFGNPKILAILMRRAKKRCRPLWRTIVARTFQAIAAMIILLILYIAWFFSGKPVITTNYIAELNKFVRPSADDSTNAYPLYNKAIKALVDTNDAKKFLSNINFYDTNDEQKNLISQWLAKNEEPLALVTKGSKLPYCWQRYESKEPEQNMLSVLMPDLLPSRNIAYALCWRAWLNAQSNDFNSAFQDIETCYRLGRHCKSEKTLVEQLIGMAIETKALDATRRLIDSYLIDSNTLASFQHSIQSLIDNEDFKPNMQFEQLLMLDEIQRSFTNSRFGPGHIYPKHIFGTPEIYNPVTNSDLILKLLFMNPNKAETITAVNALCKFVEENITKTPARLHAEGINLSDESFHFAKDNNNLFLQMLVPGIERVNITSWRNKIDAESTTLIIALVRYKQDTGVFPESLDKLVEQGYIKQIPIDPFSDKPLAYHKTDSSFILYSWGENLKGDDGQITLDKNGKPEKFADTGDWVFWPVVDGKYEQK